LAQRHGVSTWFISQGTVELRRFNLIEVEYDELNQFDNEDRKANNYHPNPLYDWNTHQRQFKELSELYGADRLDRAKTIIQEVLEDNDINAASTMITLENTYGPGVVDEATELIKLKSNSNPKKSVAYLIRTIENIGERKI